MGRHSAPADAEINVPVYPDEAVDWMISAQSLGSSEQGRRLYLMSRLAMLEHGYSGHDVDRLEQAVRDLTRDTGEPVSI